MNVMAMRMEGQYARLLNRLMQRYRVTPVADTNSEQVGALARLYWTELLLLGYVPSSYKTRGTFELIGFFESDPLLTEMPIAVAIAAGLGDLFDEEQSLAPQWAGRILPIDACDFMTPYLEILISHHVGRFRGALDAVRDADLPAEPDGLNIDFPWE